ncbi:MAG: COX15/CtaA family protein [Burkholderiaceae bacterium]|nr:COX15/CtaA family protein [Burkholderiaceae bacterium]MDO9088948.1 COX15/CtaA family protein [Burkholderiaceae bacterium]MDP1968547.1 COX15/CtaA family protein [Burkholderiaceae bacterium]
MDTPALYDLAPAARLMLMGAVIALGPLAWVWLRSRGARPERRLRTLTLLTLFLTFDLVLFGAFTRLTDSGLGCPDWPGCYGHASPLGAAAPISAAQSAMPTGPVTHGKAWVEMIHRYLATGVGVLILTLAGVSGWLRMRPSAQSAPGARVDIWLPVVTLVWVCLQGAFGALTVTMKLFPAIVTLHLLGGMVLLALLCAQAVRQAQAQGDSTPIPISGAVRLLLGASLLLVVFQIALGGWVSTNYAVLACNSFPQCQGSWWPEMDFRQGFELWRALGMTAQGEHIGMPALVAIHYVHRLMAYAVLLVLVVLAWRLHRVPGLRVPARATGLLAAWQLLTGVSNVVLGWPLVAAVAHTGGAAGMVVVLTWIWFGSRSAAPLRRAATRVGSRMSA